MTPDTIDQIRRLRSEGMTNPAIAEAVGLTKSQLERLVKKHGLPPKIDMDSHDRGEAIKRMYLAGALLKDIAADLDVNIHTVSTRLRKMGIAGTRRPRAHNPLPKLVSAPPVACEAVPDTLEGRLLATQGRYRDLAAIADAEKMTLGQVTYRWHQVRTGDEGWRS